MIILQACIIDFYLSRLMRVVAMRLKMEIIFFIPNYHPSDGAALESVSTYLETKSSGFPLSNLRAVRVQYSHQLPNTQL